MKNKNKLNAYLGSTGKTISTIRRSRLIKLGINPADIKRVSCPLNARFSFETIDTPIEITPLSRLGNERVMHVISCLYERGIIQQSQCYGNALYIALNLQRIGINVKCVEGIYRVDGVHWRKHRFNEINGVFFDATAEYFLHTPVSQIDYVGYRLYSPKELLVISAAYATLKKEGMIFTTASTLPNKTLYYSEIGFNDFFLDDGGYFQKNMISAA